jgi:threonine dehydrogenase-like Zn-dependent dehydrogenase
MSDLDIAKSKLYEEELTLTIVKNSEVLFETRSHRISGFLGAIEKLGDVLEGAAVADRVAGKAIALLCVYAKISTVYAEVLSEKAKAVFEENGIRHEWKELVKNVLDLNKSGVCPFEKLATDMSDPKDAYKAFKALQESLQAYK